jgi:glucose-6-phosphate 1-dehydrogenase
VALKCFVDNWRWADVPFYIRTGKRLPTKVTEVTVIFKSPPHHLFRGINGIKDEVNKLIIRIQPDEGLALQFGMKVPGAGFNVKDVRMDFHYSDLTESYVPEAYERLLMDCLKGDATLYARGDAVEAAWRFVDPIVDAWQENPAIKLYGYPAGAWGPEAANRLFDDHGGNWHNPCLQLTGHTEPCEL